MHVFRAEHVGQAGQLVCVNEFHLSHELIQVFFHVGVHQGEDLDNLPHNLSVYLGKVLSRRASPSRVNLCSLKLQYLTVTSLRTPSLHKVDQAVQDPGVESAHPQVAGADHLENWGSPSPLMLVVIQGQRVVGVLNQLC